MKTRNFKSIIYAWLMILASVVACHARDVTLQWNPVSDPSVAGYKVYYNTDISVPPYTGTGSLQGPSPVDASSLTTATMSGLDPAKTYYFAVTAYNTEGVESSYSNTVNVAEAVLPTVSITSPVANAKIAGTTAVSISANDNVGVTRVELYLDGTLVGSDTASPYSFSINTATVAAGAHTILAKAYDAAGNVGQSAAVSVTVSTDTTAPTASIASPVASSTISGIAAVNISASDNISVSKVELYLNGTLYASLGTAPYSITWDTTKNANGAYTLSAKAYDSAGNVGQSSSVVVNVNNPAADTIVPTSAIASPAAGAVVSGTATVTVNAADNVGIAKVEFYVNGILNATDTASPYSFSWNSSSVANGSYALTAKAYDAAGNIGQSSSVTVTVNNQVATVPSTVTIWPDTAIPGVVDSGPDNAVEVGVKFRSDASGYITGIRFYKAATNTGTHVGNLWSSTGAKLATVTFANETASGWQQVQFSTPVAISANTVYVASYHTNTGHYSADQNYFNGKGVDTPPLHALANGVSGNSGVFAYGATSAFPNQGWNSSNYWVDVMYSATISSDSAAPVVSISSPAGSATVTGTVSVTANASDNVGVSKVEFYVNGVLKATASAAPYSFSWNSSSAANGAYSLSAKAYDAAGNVGQSAAVPVTVNNIVVDTTAPVASITAPTGSSFSVSRLTIRASATDNVAVARMELYIDGVLKSSVNASTLSYSWYTSVKGAHVITIKAYDAKGNVGTKSKTITRV